MENDIKHSEDFIKNKVGKKPYFKLPTDYFDTIENEITAKISEDKLDKTNAFKVPEDYFSNVEHEVFKNINFNQKTTKVISFKERLRKAIPYAAAASIALFISLNTFVFNTNKELNFDAISDSEIEYWLDENTVSTSEIITILEDEILDENAFTFANINDESIEDYINSIDNTSLLNELN
ncbi:hypothetical protein [Polaribacter sp. R77954]|uniref:hypothetical protein n=1 Tax=Polaribacter sp. R77954 TaxID=3093870 RepID=UPI0037CCAC26